MSFVPDPLDLGYIILCPDRNIKGLKNSIGGIRHHGHKDREVIATVGSDVTQKELKEMKELCPVYKGKDTITSLINTGMRHLKHEWGFLLFDGSRISPHLERKLAVFATDPKDVLYPVVENRYTFCDAPFNGILINKETFKKVGKFTEGKMQKEGFDEFQMAKLFWALDAEKQNCKFKGIVGLKII